ncbi:MAG: hypothetical protein EP349_03435 [Alphaproteobacteria bacterium]|nr:MAG: hypothetical protein EP349_03435 [Alphaproteobacteria bacterium]
MTEQKTSALAARKTTDETTVYTGRHSFLSPSFGRVCEDVTWADVQRLRKQMRIYRRAVKAAIRMYRKVAEGKTAADVIYISQAEEEAHLRDVLESRLELYHAAQSAYHAALRLCVTAV